jgi:hypothetical protein
MAPPAKHRKQDMTTKLQTNDRNYRAERQYTLRRGLGFWQLTFQDQQAIFKHELGALYVACLLLDPPREPIHAVALALNLHLHEYLLVPSGRGGGYARAQAALGSAGCFTYQPPPGVTWVG